MFQIDYTNAPIKVLPPYPPHSHHILDNGRGFDTVKSYSITAGSFGDQYAIAVMGRELFSMIIL